MELDRDQEVVEILMLQEQAYRETFAESAPERFATVQVTLARAQARLGEFANAERRLLQAQETLVALEPDQTEAHKKAVDALIALYQQWHLHHPDGGYDARISAWQANR